MYKIIHITDVHMALDGNKIVRLDPHKRLSFAIDTINREYSDADLCVITGDLADAGDMESYQRLKMLLKTLSVPHQLMMGNHDNRAVFRQVFPEAQTDQNGFVQACHDLANTRLIFLDTLDDDRCDTGILCEQRLAWLRDQLDASTDKTVVIFMHHPPQSIGVKYFDRMMLKHPKAFNKLIAKYPSVKHIVFGHVHLTSTGRWGDISFSCNRGTCHHIVLSLDSDVIEYMDTPPNFDLILIGKCDVVVQHVTPVARNAILAKEYTTADGKGRLEYPDTFGLEGASR